MLKKTISFEDLDGNTRTEDFYFNISKAEIAKMEITFPDGGFAAYLKRIGEPGPDGKPNAALIMDTFEDFIRKSVGRRHEDGVRFQKSTEITERFMESDAYSVFFMELVTDANKGLAFVKGIFPADLHEAMDEEAAKQPVFSDHLTTQAIDVFVPTEPVKPKPASEMTVEELREAYKQKNGE